MPQILMSDESMITDLISADLSSHEDSSTNPLEFISQWLNDRYSPNNGPNNENTLVRTPSDRFLREQARHLARSDARSPSLHDIWAEAQAHEVVLKLMSVEKYRKLFSAESADIFRGLIDSLDLPNIASAGRVIEIGAGTGQLRSWLPEDLRDSVMHTEPLALAIGQFHRRWPDANIFQAKAECLPFDDGEVGLAMGLCVLDGVDDGLAVARELARVLRPGGYFVHMLDLSSDLTSVLNLFSESSVIPLPNVFSDPTGPLWPEDMFLVQHQHLNQILRVLLSHGHTLAPRLASYLGVFERKPFDARLAVMEYLQLAATEVARDEFERMFLDAFLLADMEQKEALADFSGQPCSSSWLFAERLARWFSPERGFEIIQSEIVTQSHCVELSTTQPLRSTPQLRYESLCVGEMRHLPDIPVNTLNPDAKVDHEKGLVELGVFCFVARRI